LNASNSSLDLTTLLRFEGFNTITPAIGLKSNKVSHKRLCVFSFLKILSIRNKAIDFLRNLSGLY
jgi:hypothetical protein